MYSVGTIYLEIDEAKMRINAKFGEMGSVWIDVKLPKDFYDCIMKLAHAEIAVHEQMLRATLLGKEATNDTN